MTQQQPDRDVVKKQLMTLRIIWAALLMGPVMFMAIVLFMISQRSGPNPTFNLKIFQMACLIFLVGAVPASYVLRRVVYGSRDDRGKIPMARYSSGNVIFWAMNEGVAFFALVCMFLHGQMLPFLAYAAIPLVNELVNFPTGTDVQGMD